MQWQYLYGEESYAVDESEIPVLIESGYITAETYVYADGFDDWTPCGETSLAGYLSVEGEVPREEPVEEEGAPELATAQKYPALAGKKKSGVPFVYFTFSILLLGASLAYVNWTIPGLLSGKAIVQERGAVPAAPKFVKEATGVAPVVKSPSKTKEASAVFRPKVSISEEVDTSGGPALMEGNPFE